MIAAGIVLAVCVVLFIAIVIMERGGWGDE